MRFGFCILFCNPNNFTLVEAIAALVNFNMASPTGTLPNTGKALAIGKAKESGEYKEKYHLFLNCQHHSTIKLDTTLFIAINIAISMHRFSFIAKKSFCPYYSGTVLPFVCVMDIKKPPFKDEGNLNVFTTDKILIVNRFKIVVAIYE